MQKILRYFFTVLVMVVILFTSVAVQAYEEMNMLSIEQSAQVINEAIATAGGGVPTANFVLSGDYMGLEIAVASLRILANASGTMDVTNGRFTASITHEEINHWAFEGNAVIEILFTTFSNEVHQFEITARSGMLRTPVNFSDSPIFITANFAEANFTDEQRETFAVMFHAAEDEQLQSGSLLLGTFSSDGNIFTFLLFENGTFHTFFGQTPPLSPSMPTELPQPTSISMRFYIGLDRAIVNGVPVIHDAVPFIDPVYGRTMVPLRIVSDAFGAQQIEWIEESRTVVIVIGGAVIVLPIDQPLPDNMGVPVIIDGRTYVPLRFVAEFLGATVEFDDDYFAVNIWM